MKRKSAYAWMIASLVRAGTLADAHAAEEGLPASPGMHEHVVFDRVAPLAASGELERRLLTPLLQAALQAHVAAQAQAISEQSLDLRSERFAYYVPRGEAPPAGYRLLVFVPPWQEAALPHAWRPVLDRHATVLVTAAGSGNTENVIGRRIPLALTAAENIERRVRIDPEQRWIGGLSGGSRVAQRIALAYPDEFRGAVLNAGSDPFGSPGLPFPPAPLLARFEQQVRLVYATGTRDESNAATDRASRASAHDACVDDVVELPMHNLGHVLLDAGTLDRALSALEAERSPSPRLDACRARRAQSVATALERVQRLIEQGNPAGAREALDAVDARYGALAAPQSLEFARRLDTPPTAGSRVAR